MIGARPLILWTLEVLHRGGSNNLNEELNSIGMELVFASHNEAMLNVKKNYPE